VNIPLVITAIVVGVAVILGLLSRGRAKMDLEEWTVAGRRFGGVFLWVLAAGEIYTTFTFLGAAGYAYGEGGPVFYILGYGTLAYIISFFILPPIWRYAKRNGLVTQADYFRHRFSSPWLGLIAAVVGVVFLVPYLDLQLEGLGDIVTTVTNGAIPRAVSMTVAFALVALFVFASGLRSTAWTSVLKDALLIAMVLVIGIGIPLHYFGSYAGVIHAVNHAHPGFLTLPGGSGNLGIAWLISTLLLTSFGFYMYPHAFLATYSAKSAKAIRRNATWLPLYQVLLLLLFYVGFAALLVVPGLKGAQTNFALLDLTKKVEPAWITGLVGGAGALAAMVPASVIVLASATLIGRDIFQGIIRPGASAVTVMRVSRAFIIIIMGVALYIAISVPSIIVNLLLASYDGVTQFFPAIILSLVWRRTSSWASGAGILVGVALVLYLVSSGHDPIFGLNAGIVALTANVLVIVVGSLLFPGRPRADILADYAPVPGGADPGSTDLAPRQPVAR
jgi:SSS family solute:Na+ symporter